MDLLNDHPVLLPSSLTSDLYPPDRPLDTIENYLSDVEDSKSVSIRNSSSSDEAVFDDDYDHNAQSRHSSPHTSDDDISELPNDSRAPSCVFGASSQSPFTPHKTRSPFRNPSSVLALQLEDTTPPHLTSGSSPRRYRLNTPSRTSTPRSTHSYHSTTRSLRSPTRKPAPQKEYPLVLLHVTLLPIQTPYSLEIMSSLLPPSTISNWQLLREKVSHTVLERGILIPHPRDDYDLLEERLLESLELRIPRILKCGHFHLSPEEEADAMAASDNEHDCDDDSDAGDADICPDCNRRIRDGKLGATGTGNRRWDIRIYAANGLMRAGAWGAAWREMERVDVEIWPWIDDALRRELDAKQDEANVAAAAEAELLAEREQEQQQLPLRGSPNPRMDEQRRKEIYGDEAEAVEDEFLHTIPLHPQPSPTPSSSWPQSSKSPSANPWKQANCDLPLFQLLINYFSILLRDRKNIALLALSILVLAMALRPAATYPIELSSFPSSPSSAASSPSIPSLALSSVPSEEPIAQVSDAASKVFVTVTEALSAAASAASEVAADMSGGVKTMMEMESASIPSVAPEILGRRMEDGVREEEKERDVEAGG